MLSLSSCISLLYASGRPFSIVSSVTRSPYTRPVLPRTSSAISGFFFWGIIDEPVVNASDNSTNPNSQDDHSTSSSESRDRCIITMAISAASSTQKSRSDTPSIEFRHTFSMPSFSASDLRSVGYVVPASAQLPIGEILMRFRQSESRSMSRSSIIA